MRKRDFILILVLAVVAGAIGGALLTGLVINGIFAGLPPEKQFQILLLEKMAVILGLGVSATGVLFMWLFRNKALQQERFAGQLESSRDIMSQATALYRVVLSNWDERYNALYRKSVPECYLNPLVNTFTAVEGVLPPPASGACVAFLAAMNTFVSDPDKVSKEQIRSCFKKLQEEMKAVQASFWITKSRVNTAKSYRKEAEE